MSSSSSTSLAMDISLRSVLSKKATKKTHKPKKKKPIKVVYISNPMKVKATASEFRALVQELTGQDAEFPDPSKYPDAEDVGWHRTVPDSEKNVDNDDQDHEHVQDEQAEKSDDVQFGMFEEEDDDVFVPEMVENYSGFLQSSLLYESLLHVDV